MNNIITRGLGLFQSLIAMGYDLYIRIKPTENLKLGSNATGLIQIIKPEQDLDNLIKDLIETKKIIVTKDTKEIEVEVFIMRENIQLSVEEQKVLAVPLKVKVTI